MSKTVINYILKVILLILAQAVIFNNIVLFNVAVAFVYIYAIVSMPVTWHTNISLTIGFFTGLAVDIFADTQGINALASTILAFVRKPVFHLYVQDEEDFGGLNPGLRTMGTPAFLKYLSTLSLIFCTCYFVIEAFAFFDIVVLGLRIACSTLFTFIVIYALDNISTLQNEKRL